MRGRQILITGGAGFVGSNLAMWFKRNRPDVEVVALDNLKRRGSEFNLPRLREHGVLFVHADIRNPEDLHTKQLHPSVLIECSAEPSVLAGYESPGYVVNTNLVGTVNCLELARRSGADVIFPSTSRVYPVKALNGIRLVEAATRFEIAPEQDMPGVSTAGIREDFPMGGARSLYGATKLCSELLLQEYGQMYGLRYVINRCGVIAGPWQMGKADQGVFTLWMAHHYFRKPLSYIGWGGGGKQARDVLHIDDLAELIDAELRQLRRITGRTYNVGGGARNVLSLRETTRLCRTITRRRVRMGSLPESRPDDVKVYVTDNAAVSRDTGWVPRRSSRETLQDILDWIRQNERMVAPLWR